MKKNVINEINQMKFLFGYKAGKVLSEQELPEMEDLMVDDEMEDLMVDDEMEDLMIDDEMSDFDFGPEVAPTPTRERTKEKEETEKPYRPGRPDRDPNRLPYTDPDTHPQGRRRPSMDRDEVEYELEIDDTEKPMRRMRDMDMGMEKPMRRMRDMDENIYEVEIDDDIESLFK
jgi:hypothetical protein